MLSNPRWGFICDFPIILETLLGRREVRNIYQGRPGMQKGPLIPGG